MQTIDITPTWRQIAGIIEMGLCHADAQGQKLAREELRRMADLADRYNHLIAKLGDEVAREYLATYGADK